MKPIYKITANGTDLDLGERLISLSCSDESGFKSDSCSITLDDHNSMIAIPSTGTVLSVYLGYESTGISHIGDYIVNNVSLSGAPIESQSKLMDWILSPALRRKFLKITQVQPLDH